jgi:hypothetical protein
MRAAISADTLRVRTGRVNFADIVTGGIERS